MEDGRSGQGVGFRRGGEALQPTVPNVPQGFEPLL